MNPPTGLFRRYWLNLPLRRKGLIVTAIPLVALLVFSIAFVVVQRGYMNAGRWLKSALDIYAATQKIQTVVLEQDKTLTGYGLTGEPEYLKAYRDVTKQHDEALTQLRKTVRGDANQAAHIATISKLLAERQAAADGFISDAGKLRGREIAASGRIWLALNRILTDKIDGEVTSLQNGAKGTLTAQALALARAIKTSDYAVMGCIAIGLGGGIFAMVLFASGIVRRITELQINAGGLARGDFQESAVSSKDEIGKLGDTLRATAAVLRKQRVDLDQRAQELTNSEAANHKQARLMECILDSMAEGVLVADHTGELVLCNPAARNMLGEKALDGTLSHLMSELIIYRADTMTPCPADELPLVRAIRGETPAPTGLVLRDKKTGDDVWIDATARPLRRSDDVTRGGVSVFRDVTAARKMEEFLRQARAEAEQANHAKSEFLSRMSHELRTPMNAILGFAQLLDLDDLSTPQRQSVDQILKGGRHLLTLINEVLDLARIEAGKMTLSIEPIHVGEAVQSTVDLLQPLAREHRIRFRRIASADWNTYVLADRQRFQQVILNLVSNAIKYNQAGGSVTVACMVQGNTNFRLAITDTGEGLPAEKMHKLFQPFERLVSDQSGVEGTGIGLALSKRLMVAMGGTIGAESRVGAGSTFWAELPVCACPLDACPHPQEEDLLEKDSLQASGNRATKLLYVEDNLSNNLLMERILQSRPDIQLISAMQGRLGLELAAQHAPDLIFLDLHLPDIGGDEVLRALRQRRATAHTPIVMISADATPSQIERLLAAGASEYFTKPLDVKRLLNYVDEVLGVGV